MSSLIYGAEPSSAESFLRVIRANDLKALKEMGQSGVVEVGDAQRWTPLHYAAVCGSTDAVRLVLEAGGDPNAANRAKVTPLMMGASHLEKTRLFVGKSGNAAAVRLLIENGADVKYVMPTGQDYVMRAAGRVDAGAVKLTIERGMNTTRVAPTRGSTAISYAIDHHTTEKVRLLLATGVDVNVANVDGGFVRNGPIESTGVTPLMDAASMSEPAVLTALMKARARVNTKDDRQMTALIMAAATDRPAVEKVRQLIAAGAHVNVDDRDGETALDWARKHRNPDVVALLTKVGAKEKAC